MANFVKPNLNETYLFPLAKNNIKPGKQAMTNLDMVKSSVKPTISEISDIVVHSSVKGHRDVTRSRVGSSLKDNFKLEHSGIVFRRN